MSERRRRPDQRERRQLVRRLGIIRMRRKPFVHNRRRLCHHARHSHRIRQHAHRFAHPRWRLRQGQRAKFLRKGSCFHAQHREISMSGDRRGRQLDRQGRAREICLQRFQHWCSALPQCRCNVAVAVPWFSDVTIRSQQARRYYKPRARHASAKTLHAAR